MKGVRRLLDFDKLSEAIDVSKRGLADKASFGNVTGYKVKNIIRIDIKGE